MAKVTVSVPKYEARELQKFLNGQRSNVDDSDVVYVVTATFDDGYQADIKVCGGEPPYIDPVLFDEDGNQADVLSPDDTLLGEYQFAGGRTVVVTEV